MSTDKIDPNKKDATISSTDDFSKASKSGDVELTKEELDSVSGGKPPTPGGPVPIPYPNLGSKP